MSDIRAGRISTQDFIGNDVADALAKKAAGLWRLSRSDRQSISYWRGRAWRIGLRLAAVTLDCVKHFKNDITLQPATKPCKRESLTSLICGLKSLGHVFEEGERRMHCKNCGLSWLRGRKQVRLALRRGSCKGAKTFLEHRVVQGELFLGVDSKPAHASHRIMHWAGVYYCALCGCWGTSRVVKLSLACARTPTAAGAEVLRRIGLQLPPAPGTMLQPGISTRPVLVTPGSPEDPVVASTL